MTKQKVRILADATMDLPPETVKDLDIGVLPSVVFERKPF